MINANGRQFANMQQVHAWAFESGPEKLVIDILGPQQVMPMTWRYNAPAGIEIRGLNGGSWHCRTTGWLFAYRPAVDKQQSPLSFESMEFSGSGRGGINLGPVFEGDYNAGGETAWLDNVGFVSCKFYDIGSQSCDSAMVGFAAIYAQGVRSLMIDGCTFKNIVNKPCKQRHESLIHAAYCVDNTHAMITNCVFRHVSGDPIRVRDGAYAKVTNCWSIRSGQRAMASSWRQPKEKPGTAEFKNNVVAHGFQGQRIKEWAA